MNLLAVFTLVACAGSPEGISPPTSGSTPPPAVASPAPAVAPPAIVFPTPEQLASATKVTKGDFTTGGLLGMLRPVQVDPRCLGLSDGSPTVRDVMNIDADGKQNKDQPKWAIAFHSGNSTCGRNHTYWRVPFLFVERAYILPNQFYLEGKNSEGTFRCVIPHVSNDTNDSWCIKQS
jgi:hypothetical protein